MTSHAVLMGKYTTAQAPDILESRSVGSCMVICLYDALSKTGSMAHCMLPTAPDIIDEPGKYVDSAVDTMIAEMTKRGILHNRIQAKIAGGAHMFQKLIQSDHSIGTQNITKVHEVLHRHNIPIVAEDVGGSVGRNVTFQLHSGSIEVQKKM